ncbi:MAG TPA: 4-hydroxybenzoate octaprenyltransferase [Burkholderiales bacterium]|nr:4-hydroxybenzoate octaprenyltransferase [Burkholderiales bacterium]
MTLKQRLDAYEKLMRLDKPIGALLLLWPALWALWLAARGFPASGILLIFIVGTILMRSAGCVVNDFADRNFDPHVERTRDRPLAAKLVKPWEALMLAAVLALAAFALVLHLNRLTVMLSFVAVALAVIYPFLKRVFSFPQAWLGIAFGFGIPMAYAAQRGELPAVAWVLLLANIFWAIAYDTEYAMVDRDDDVRIGVKSSAILLGRYDVAGVMAAHVLFLAIMGGIGWWQSLGVLYYCGLAIAAGLVVYQHALIKGRERSRCFKAFLNNNWVGAAVFTGLALDLYFGIRISF